MTARAIFRTSPRPRRAAFGLAVIVALGALWLAAASRVHVNTSWSDGAWGYLAIPLIGAPEVGDRVLFEPPDVVGSEVAYRSVHNGTSRAAASLALAASRFEARTAYSRDGASPAG